MNIDSIRLLKQDRIAQVSSQIIVTLSLITSAGKLKKVNTQIERYRNKLIYFNG